MRPQQQQPIVYPGAYGMMAAARPAAAASPIVAAPQKPAPAAPQKSGNELVRSGSTDAGLATLCMEFSSDNRLITDGRVADASAGFAAGQGEEDSEAGIGRESGRQ